LSLFKRLKSKQTLTPRLFIIEWMDDSSPLPSTNIGGSGGQTLKFSPDGLF
jgi:hypothetical protein